MKSILFSTLVLLIFVSCTKEEFSTEIDQQLYNEISSNEGYLYYQNGETLEGSSCSPNGFFKLRFNSTAQSVLDRNNELPVGSSFPTNSILVKEVYTDGSLTMLVLMKKNPSGPDAGQGWQWAQYRPDGSVVYSFGNMGEACITCHSLGSNRDLTRTFDLH